MDYSAFIEGCQMLGAVLKDDLLYQKAFCSASGKSVRYIDSTYLTHDQFKKGWLQVLLLVLLLLLSLSLLS